MHEEPLHLIPDELRAEMQRGVRHLHRGRPLPALPLRRLERASTAGRHRGRAGASGSPSRRRTACGIGTFTPSDPKSQDISELTGSIDLSTIGEYGVECDPRAYRFDGELNIANRGLMEFIEMLKCDEKFLYVLLTLSQEQNIKTGRFSMIYADEVIVSHTNENEYNVVRRQQEERGAAGPHHPGARCPTTCGSATRSRSTRSCSSRAALQGRAHRAAHAAGRQSMFAMLSRLEPSKKAGMSLMKKLKLYDGEEVEGFSQKDVRELQEETVREGMDGISPALRHQPPLQRAGPRGRRPASTRSTRCARCATAWSSTPAITREERERLPEPDRRGAQGVRRAGQEGGPAGLRLLLRGDGPDAAEQLPGQRRGVLQQGRSCATRSPRRRSSRTSS